MNQRVLFFRQHSFALLRNGSGEEMHVLFREDGCAINGFAHEYEEKDKGKLTDKVPAIFNEFIFGEPVTSIGTTFCLWTTENIQWTNVDKRNGSINR